MKKSFLTGCALSLSLLFGTASYADSDHDSGVQVLKDLIDEIHSGERLGVTTCTELPCYYLIDRRTQVTTIASSLTGAYLLQREFRHQFNLWRRNQMQQVQNHSP